MRDVICNEAIPFRPYCAGVATRTRNVSEYMLVLSMPSSDIAVMCYTKDRICSMWAVNYLLAVTVKVSSAHATAQWEKPDSTTAYMYDVL